MSIDTVNLDDLHSDDDPIVVDGAQSLDTEDNEQTEPIVDDAVDNQGQTSDPDNSVPVASTDAPDIDDVTSDPRTDTGEKEIVDGINSFLAEFNIENGIIQIEGEDGNPVEKPFNELSETEKFNVLKSLSSQVATDIEKKHDLSQSEIDVLNVARNAKVDIKEYIEEMAQQRARDINSLNSASTGVDFDSMEDDAIFMKFMKESSPEATEEMIAEELANAKNGKLYKDNVNRIRETFKQQQESEEKAESARLALEQEAQLEEERAMIVNKVIEIDKISDWDVTDEDKNQVLEKMLELNQYGDPVFLEEVFSDPKEFFKAAWLYYNADAKFNEMATYYKKEQTNAFNRGFNKASKGMSPEPISGSRSSNNDSTPKPRPALGQKTSNLTLADLDD